MKQHFSEADLLETYYTKPGESMPVMMHLADCAECAARYDRLEGKMHSLRACPHDEKPETFWARQRLQIMRKIDVRRERRATFQRVTRIAAAAMLVVILGALLTWRRADTRAVATTTAAAEVQIVPSATSTSDPWQSDELKDYSSMVAWESWVEDGDHS